MIFFVRKRRIEMNYNEKVQWLIHYDNKNINSPEILRRASIIKDDVRELN